MEETTIEHHHTGEPSHFTHEVVEHQEGHRLEGHHVHLSQEEEEDQRVVVTETIRHDSHHHNPIPVHHHSTHVVEEVHHHHHEEPSQHVAHYIEEKRHRVDEEIFSDKSSVSSLSSGGIHRHKHRPHLSGVLHGGSHQHHSHQEHEEHHHHHHSHSPSELVHKVVDKVVEHIPHIDLHKDEHSHHHTSSLHNHNHHQGEFEFSSAESHHNHHSSEPVVVSEFTVERTTVVEPVHERSTHVQHTYVDEFAPVVEARESHHHLTDKAHSFKHSLDHSPSLTMVKHHHDSHVYGSEHYNEHSLSSHDHHGSHLSKAHISSAHESTKSTFTIPCHHIRIGDLVILQHRPCQIIRITTSAQTGQHRYLGVDLFTKQLHEEPCVVSHPSPSVVLHSLLGPVFKQYRLIDIRDDGRLVAMTETGEIKQGLKVVDQGHLWGRLKEAFGHGSGSVRVLVISDHGKELAVDYKIVHLAHKL